MTKKRVNAIRSVKMLDIQLDEENLPPEAFEPAPEPTPSTMPFALSKSGKAKHALRELRVKQDRAGTMLPVTLPSAPGINALSIAIRHLPGGRKTFLEYVKLAARNGDPSAEAFWNVYADLPQRLRNVVNMDDVLEACGLKPGTLLAAVVGHGVEAGTDVANLIAATLAPQLIAAAGKSALRIDGEHAQIAAEDRRALLQARGFLPAPKGASIYVNANAQANSNATAAAATSADPSVPRFADDMAALATIPSTAVRVED